MGALAVLQSVLVAALAALAFGFMALQLRRAAVLVATGTAGDETLTDAPAERLAKLVSLSFGHRKVLEDPGAGLLHAVFLYGFFVLGIGHLEVILEGLTSFRMAFGHRPFSYARVLPEGITNVYHLSQDVFAAAVLVAAAVALVRRFAGRPARLLPRSSDGERILWFLLALYATFFLLAGPSLLLRQRLGLAANGWAQPVQLARRGRSRVGRDARGTGAPRPRLLGAHVRLPGLRGLLAHDEAHAPGLRVAEPLLLPPPALWAPAARRLREDREVRHRPRAGAAVEEPARLVRVHGVRTLQLGVPGARHRQAAHADEGPPRREGQPAGSQRRRRPAVPGRLRAPAGGEGGAGGGLPPKTPLVSEAEVDRTRPGAVRADGG